MQKDYFEKRKTAENTNIQTLLPKTWTRKKDRNGCSSILVLKMHAKKIVLIV